MNAGSIAPTGLSNTVNLFANFAWDCSSQFGNIDMLAAGTTMTVNQTFSLKSTGTKELRFSAAGKAAISAFAYTQTAGHAYTAGVSNDGYYYPEYRRNLFTNGGTLNGVGSRFAWVGHTGF
jgi:hypothetical protein